jgi:hypothetical protein
MIAIFPDEAMDCIAVHIASELIIMDTRIFLDIRTSG